MILKWEIPKTESSPELLSKTFPKIGFAHFVV